MDFCQKRHITVTAYSPLGKPGTSWDINKLDNSVIFQLAKKYNKTSAQIALRYVVCNKKELTEPFLLIRRDVYSHILFS